MRNMKIGIILQARMGSSRLPGKVLKSLAGKPMLCHIIDRLKLCKQVDEIIIATSNLESDKKITEVAVKEGVIGFCGECEENDVLSRYLKAAKKYDIDVIIRITADCPLIDPKLIDDLIIDFFESKVDYILNCLTRTYPDGVDAEVFYTSCLEKSSNLSNKIEDREQVVLPMRNNSHLFKIKNVEAKNEMRRPDLRLTVDNLEDFKLVEKIYESLYNSNDIYFSTEKIINYLDQNPELKKINSHLIDY